MKNARIVKGSLALWQHECQCEGMGSGPGAARPVRLPMSRDMRTLGARSHRLVSITAAAGLVVSLGQPWYGTAAPPPPTDAELTARVDAIAATAGRALGARDGVVGWDALARVDLALAGLAGVILLLALLSLLPPLKLTAQWLGRLAALSSLGLVAWRILDVPAATQEPRSGALLALACAALACVGMAGLSATSRPGRRAPVRAYTPPPAPPRDASASYGPPQF
jgi:hypothetical protein